MTVRLLTAWNGYPPNSLVTLDAGTEAGLVAAFLADTNLTGGTTYVPPAAPENVDETLFRSLATYQAAMRAIGLMDANGNFISTISRLQDTDILAGHCIVDANMFFSGGGTQNATWSSIVSAWAPFSAVQLMMYNPTGSAVAIDNAIVAASAGVTDAVVPTGSWSAATGSLSASNTGSAANPGITLSPKIPVKSIPRADGSPFPILFCRTFFQTGNTTYVYGQPGTGMNAANWDPRAGGHILKGGQKTGGDYVTTPGGWATGGALDPPFVIPAGFVFQYDYPVATVCGIGDSIMAADFNSLQTGTGFGFKACVATRLSGRPVSWHNGGVSSQTMQQINTRGKNIIDQLAPDIIIVPSYTINSATSVQSDWDTQWYYFMDLVQYQLAKGKKAIMLTPYPNNNFSSTIDGYRIGQRARVLSSGIPYTDIESAVCDGATPNRWKAGYNFDATHPNFTGHDAIATVLSATLLTMA